MYLMCGIEFYFVANRSRQGSAVYESLWAAELSGSDLPRQTNPVLASLRGPVPERQDVGGTGHE